MITIKTSSGADPAQVIERLKQKLRPDSQSVMYAMEMQRTRILERTQNGLDVDGRPFAPYSTKGPYYYYPNGRVGNSKFSTKQTKASVQRLYRKIGQIEGEYTSLPAHILAKIPGVSEHGDTGAKKTKNGLGIKFNSYAAFKAALGRGAVDLRGPRAPHMLQGILIKLAGGSPVSEARMGIYGDAADRASGHNYGARNLPIRRFLGVSQSDLKQMANDIVQHLMSRIKL
jgi:hypothetical protein